MSRFLLIDDTRYFATLKSTKDEVSFAVTDFKAGFRQVLRTEELVSSAEKFNPFLEIEPEKLVEILNGEPETLVSELSDSGLSIKTKHKIAGVAFKFEWSLAKMSPEEFCDFLVLPALDALSEVLRQVDTFKTLPNQDIDRVGSVPSYGCFDLRDLVVAKNDALTEICKKRVQRLTEASSSNGETVARKIGLTLKKNKRKTNLKRLLEKTSSKSITKPVYGGSQSSQD